MYVVALDCGTTGVRALAFNENGEITARAYKRLSLIFPRPGWVEQDPELIFQASMGVLKEVISRVGAENVAALGITNQRETTLLWDRATGKPVYNAIVWQCRRTEQICEKLSEYKQVIREKTGLVLDPYFSATKIRWVLENVPKAGELLRSGRLVFGTVDSWLLFKLTGMHATDESNASRTLLFNIHKLEYDEELLEIFKVPPEILPEVKGSSEIYGYTKKELFLREIPVAGLIGDQQASLFAHFASNRSAKITYGTGVFLLARIDKPELVQNLATTVAWKVKKVSYALEGSIFMGGSLIDWLVSIGLLNSVEESEELASSLKSNEGVYFVPAFNGLGSPFWDANARGLIIGLTRKTSRAHIARAALEGIAYRVKDIFEELSKYVKLSVLGVDGGASRNNFLLQFQADLLGLRLERPRIFEATALGAAELAGLALNFWDFKDLTGFLKAEKVFVPERSREMEYKMWREAVKRCMSWTGS